MSYKVKKIKREYHIIENDILTIRKYNSKNDANDYCRRLNLGAGFNGHTPEFMTREIKKPPEEGGF